ncbi:MAG: HlyD family efflux transporter periplasmic adaptor subunit [Nitrospirae bacterium]|nr:MAG: HlyD family efflux transporter periplasmic adaptor subunit [Nitrospirota bacterium]
MTTPLRIRPLRQVLIPALLCFVLFLSGCRDKTAHLYQGYAEGEYLLVAAPNAGRLEKRWVQRGQSVEAGAPLFALERENEQAGQREAGARLRTAEARLANLVTGRRASEIDALAAEVARAGTALELSTLQLRRQKELFAKGYIARTDLDVAQTAHSRDRELAAEAAARLRTATESIGRDKEIAAARAEVEASRAALEQSSWKLTQRAVHAPAAALVHDTFYTEGEWVQGGFPVMSLLPPANIKVRFFVPEAVVGSLKVGRALMVSCDGCSKAVRAKISFISGQAEYTPPVIYSRDQRTRLVFLVEAMPDAADAALLHPGQPVDVELK